MCARSLANIRCVNTIPPMPSRSLLLAAFALMLFATSFDAGAQGFPGGGGGGHGGMGRGMRPPRDADRPNAQPGQPAPNPLVTFLGTLHALRAAIVVRADQADAWTAMQDALLAVADTDRSAQAPASSDPATSLRTYVDALDERAAATKAAGDRIAAVLAVLDDTQKTMFLARLGEAFAGPTARP
jgi:hypothetical protein